MKIFFPLAWAVFFLSLFTACVPEDLRTFSFDTDETVTVPGTSPLVNTALEAAEVIPDDLPEVISTSLNQELSTQNIPTDALDSLVFSQIKLTVTKPEENGTQVRDLSFLDSLTFKITDGSATATIAESEDDAFAAGVTEYTFPALDTELLPFFKTSDNLEILTEPVVNDRPNFETEILFHFEITVIAKGL